MNQRVVAGETFSVEDAARHALAWCEKHPGWQRICDIKDVDLLYKSYAELPEAERARWNKHDGETAWREAGSRPCKVPFGFITGTGAFVRNVLEVPQFHNFMMVFKTR